MFVAAVQRILAEWLNCYNLTAFVPGEQVEISGGQT